MSKRPEITLEQEEKAAQLDPVLGGSLSEEHDTKLEAIHRFFMEERAAGQTKLIENLRLWSLTHTRDQDMQRILEVAEQVRDRAKTVVVIGIGGSDLAARVIHEVLDHAHHNLLPDETRGAPRLFFTGNTFDPRRLRDLLDTLVRLDLLEDTVCIIISKSGRTGETISSALIIAEHMRQHGIDDWQQQCVAITGFDEKSVLFTMHQKTPFLALLPIHDGVGGRFSGHTEVGLLPALIAVRDASPEERLEQIKQGLQAADDWFQRPPTDSQNLAFQLGSWVYLAETWGNRTSLMFYNYADDPALGDWMVQLMSESLQERGRGINLIATTGPTGNHSILNGIIRGPRDKCVLLLHWRNLGENLTIPTGTNVGGDLQYFEGLTLTQVQTASYRGTAADFAENGVPNITLSLGQRDATHLFALFRVLMDTVAVIGKLRDLDRRETGEIDPSGELTYLQHGVEGYKAQTREQARRMH